MNDQIIILPIPQRFSSPKGWYRDNTGKCVSYTEYTKLQAENEKLKKALHIAAYDFFKLGGDELNETTCPNGADACEDARRCTYEVAYGCIVEHWLDRISEVWK